MIRRTYKYRLYPTRQQISLLEQTLGLCRELYNAALQERRDAWRLNGVSIGYAAQCAQLPEIKVARPDLSGVYSQVLQDALYKVEEAFKSFFLRVRRGVRAGYPRFKPATRFDSFTYPQSGFSLKGSKLRLSKIDNLKIKLHRPVEGKVKTLTVKREAGKWYACLSVECEPKPAPQNSASIGIDVGLTAFATLSDGSQIANPYYYREAQRQLRKAQRRVARRKKGSRRRRKAALLLRRAHAHVRSQRADFHHKISRRIVDGYGLIAVEDLNVKGLARGMLAKSVNDAAWSSFIFKISYKAEWAGGEFVKVDCRGTSQECLCGAEVRKTLDMRWHSCPSCGLSAARDHVSALLILSRALGRSVMARTKTTGLRVAIEAASL